MCYNELSSIEIIRRNASNRMGFSYLEVCIFFNVTLRFVKYLNL